MRGSGVVAALGALLCALLTVGTAVASGTAVLFLNGSSGMPGAPGPSGLIVNRSNFLGGFYADEQFSVVDYPAAVWPLTGPFDPTLGASIRVGSDHLVEAITSTSGPLLVAGTSQGAMVVQDAQQRLNADPTVPSDTTFMIIADPNLALLRGLNGWHVPILDYVPRELPQTRFHTIVVTGEYDPVADPIARPWNLLTVINAAMALIYVHPFTPYSDLSEVPPQNVSTSAPNAHGGVTTTYLIPTQQLPLTMPLRQLGLPAEWVNDVDDVLRPAIDAGYQRTPPGAGLRRAPVVRKSAPPPGEDPAPRATASARLGGSSSPPAATGTSGPRSRAR